jgi:hypothetical protein
VAPFDVSIRADREWTFGPAGAITTTGGRDRATDDRSEGSVGHRGRSLLAERRVTARLDEIGDHNLYLEGEEGPDDQEGEQAVNDAEDATDDDGEHDGEDVWPGECRTEGGSDLEGGSEAIAEGEVR